MASQNFGFLALHDAIFLQLAEGAERSFHADPNTTLIKLRQLAEALAQSLATRVGVEFDERTSQSDLLYQLNRAIGLDKTIRDLFHTLRIEGNRATHQFETSHRQAIEGLMIARNLAIWFHRSLSAKAEAFKPGPFVPPKDPSADLRALQTEMEQLKASLQESNQQLEQSKELANLKEQEAKQYEALAGEMDEEAKTYEDLAQEQEAALIAAKQEFERKLQQAQQQARDASEEAAKALAAATASVKTKTTRASQQLEMTEELTRIIIDSQLQEAGWETDSEILRFSKGARPELKKNKAIAEWPTQSGPADYVLFMGLTPVGVVEAKKQNTNVAGAIAQAERYSKTFKEAHGVQLPWREEGLAEAWPSAADQPFQVPFVYSCNGRPYLKQSAELSGTWFRDCRLTSNLARPLQSFHTAQGLKDLLERSREAAEQKLQQEGFNYLGLRDYQEKAIKGVETALEKGQRECLLAMATGTGKTRTIIGLMYRFLKAERFKRILFLVDRTALGTQALDAFNEARLEQSQTLSQIYDVKTLGDMAAEAETRVQVATVQAMVKRIFQSDKPMPLDQFDCIIIDEAHRGYTLDQEMSEGEQQVRDASQYLSSYRRVLDYFDAVKVGLTATPAKHTSEIFGKPVYTYSYREAVADDWLIDHEPPIRYETKLTQEGIKFVKGDKVEAIDVRTGSVDVSELEDELAFEVEHFNRRVVNEDFNRVICEALAKELDPTGDEKTMIFCATDMHADLVKRLLDEAFSAVWGSEYNAAATLKITGKTDKVAQQIRNFKNERFPNIAITVDLLTTGIDVPKICNLVFMRRVKSRILFEQMLGRATRRCDDIGKTVFRIYDPVDIYAALDAVNTMKPIVKDPSITIEQLVEEVCDPKTQEAPGSEAGRSHADEALDALSQKVMRIMRKAQKKADANPQLKQRLEELEQQWGAPAAELHKQLHREGVPAARTFLQQHNNLLNQLDEVKVMIGSEFRPIISSHKDEIRERTQSYGNNQKPEDYLDSFNAFIKEQVNQSAALSAVASKPRELTRAQLKEIRLLLDQHGFTEAKLESAWRNSTNQDIAASIIGHIRRAAIGEALIPFDQRVDRAMEKIFTLHSWTTPQRKWLQRLARQLKYEVIIDDAFVNQAFAEYGGVKQLNKLLDDQLNSVLDQLSQALWVS